MTTDTPIKKNWLKRIAIALGALLLVLSTLTAMGLWQMNHFIHTPADRSGKQQIIIIEPGKNLKAISRLLASKTIISRDILFRLLVRHRRMATKIQAGEYGLSAAMTPEQILAILVKGQVLLHRITVPEGLNLEETAAIVERAGFGVREDFLDLARSTAFVEQLKVRAATLEGYLFPETYFFRKDTPQEKIIQQMVQRFHVVYTPQWEQRTLDLGFSVHDIVTLASIIEKETGDGSERPLIASVFHNRLKRGMRLDSDPTVIYGIPDFNGNITRKNLQTMTPYNTYKIKGLPAGPIANPGRHALEAALFPARTDFLYFVSKKDTTHKFSKTLQEHNRAVRRYQLGK